MNTINAVWHNAHKMPNNPTHDERMIWHIKHLESCGCRKPTEKMQQEIDHYKLSQSN